MNFVIYGILSCFLLYLVKSQDAEEEAKLKAASKEVGIGQKKIEALLKEQKVCFKQAYACKLLMSERSAVGCSQCRIESGGAFLKEVRQPEALEAELRQKQKGKIVLLASETLFFKPDVLRSIVASSIDVFAVLIAEQRDYLDANDTNTSSARPDSSSGERSSDATPTANRDTQFPYPYPPVGQFSGDQRRPNKDYLFEVLSNELKQPENARGTEIQFLNVPINIFFISEEDAMRLRNLTSTNEFEAKINRLLKIESKGQAAACPEELQKEQEEAVKNAKSSDSSKKQELPKPLTNATQCMALGTCDPIGGYSVWSSLSYINRTVPDQARDIVAVTAPMDSTAFFHELAFGAAEVASVASLMAIVKAVGDYRRTFKVEPVRVPMYFAFNAQAWGFAGSGRFLEDVKNFDCLQPDVKNGLCMNPFAPNLKFKALNSSKFSVINLGGLVSQETNVTFAYFKHGFANGNVNGTGGMVEEALDLHFRNSEMVDINDGFRNGSFLDASQSFQFYLPGADVVTVTNFRRNFSNFYYHSVYDNASLLKKSMQPLYSATAAISNAVIQLSFNSTKRKVNEDPELINEFIDCLTTNWVDRNCSLAQEYLGEEDYNDIYKDVKQSNYAGIFVPLNFTKQFNPSGYGKALFLQRFMAYHNRIDELVSSTLDSVKCTNNTVCTKTLQELENADTKNAEDFRYAFCVKGKCVIAESHLHAAFGTGLKPNNTARTSFTVVTPEPTPTEKTSSILPSPTSSAVQTPQPPSKPAWVQSRMSTQASVCYAIDDTPAFGGIVLGSGLATFLLCSVGAWFINSKTALSKREEQEDGEVENGLEGAF